MRKKRKSLTKAQEKREEKEKLVSAREKAKEAGKDMKEAAKLEYEKIRRKMDETSKKVEEYIKKNPKRATIVSAGVGAALGAIIAMLISRKRK
ncbi:MAG TPA: DUF883 C-terminal domain-containing protein [Candidatus Moranbacteria bacterium]|jgi:ElaB/YqjD/DUF883 family membrane-anchored ribosome-binding protein|nr:DUF883 family protein [Candidatus Moranbacteria bacterium]HOF42406.1 DUF883 C-terminal domain-containing protein [Candidatus Moranbacteria bacterium]HPX94040.1 DUF883 C-terminal domain-containing protein [Candidatus Moranbacteria bacterium]HQB59762.1 DUF883 C-terminal domain-containing protein [Candidatus Moranbacteria bacterium]